MNYIKLINSFWEIKRENESIDVYATTLYFTLLYLANKNNWQPFSVYRDDILELAGIRKTVYYDARKILQDAGLITFDEGNKKASKCTFNVRHTDIKTDIKQGNMSATRTISGTLARTIHNKQDKLNKPINIKGDVLKNENDYEKENGFQNMDRVERNEILQPASQMQNNYTDRIGNSPRANFGEEVPDTQNTVRSFEAKTFKLNTEPEAVEEKEKKVSAQKKEKEFSDVQWPFDSTAFMEAWKVWTEYRKQKKQKPYVPIGLQAVLKELSNDANGNEAEAIEIIKYSMGKNWNGLYPNRNKTNQPNQHKSNGKPKYDFNELLAEVERTAGPTSFSRQGS